LPATSNIKIAQAQLTERFELVATIEPPSQVASGTTLTELNFTTDYEVSLLLSFSQDTNLNIPQGTISPPLTHQPINASIHDNRGNTFLPIINGTTITNPTINNLNVPAFFNYTITLYFKTIGDATFRSEIGNFAWTYGTKQVSVPLSITFRLPKDYTPFQYANGSSKTADNQYTIFNWNFAQGDNISCFVVFLPFSIEPTVRSMGITVEVLSNSANSGLKETFNMTYDLVGTIMIWNVSLIMPIYIQFPNNMNGTQVESVLDGQGQCQPRTEPIDPNSINPLGKYFVDDQNKLVTIYPRNSYQDITQKFDVQITFIVPNNSSNNAIDPHIPFYEPYKGSASLVFYWGNSSSLHLNMTGSFQVTFIFPLGVDSFSSLDREQLVLGETEDHRATVTLNYNSPINMPKNQWVILFDTTSLKNFYLFAWINNLLLSIAVTILVVAIKRTKFQSEIALPESLSVGVLLFLLFASVSANTGGFFYLPWFPIFIVFSWVLEVSLSVVVLLLLWQFYKKRRRITKKPEDLIAFKITVPIKMFNHKGQTMKRNPNG
jgi:hypothetical protein